MNESREIDIPTEKFQEMRNAQELLDSTSKSLADLMYESVKRLSEDQAKFWDDLAKYAETKESDKLGIDWDRGKILVNPPKC